MKTRELFELYTAYFAKIDKKLKVERNGRIKIIDQKTWEVEIYSSWSDLENAYNLQDELQESKEEKSKEIPQFKYWVFGDPTRHEELKELMGTQYLNTYGEDLCIEVEFKKKDWVYYLDSAGNLCQTNNSMVIDLLKNSSDWTQLILPIKKFTMEDIAKLVGLPIDQFEIV